MNQKTLNVYEYQGPVMSFGRVIKDDWTSVTTAVSEKKARNNLTYQYKKIYGRSVASSIDLPGDITIVGTVPEKNGQMSLEDLTF